MRLSRRRLLIAIAGALLVLAGVLLWLFGAGADIAIYRALHLDRHSALVRPVALLSTLGGGDVMIAVALGGVAVLSWQRRIDAALWMAATIASGRTIIELTKAVVGRLRPDIADQLVPVISASFPSSHSAGSMLTAAAFALAFRPSRPLFFAIAAWPAAIGLSRVMLGVHWPSDVLAGWGFGMSWASLLSLWLRPRVQLPSAAPPS